MLQLTLESGRVVQRVFCGNIESVDDLAKFYRELQQEIADNHTGNPIFIEMWKDATAQVTRKRDRKAIMAS